VYKWIASIAAIVTTVTIFSLPSPRTAFARPATPGALGPNDEPGNNDADTAMAINHPDAYAWRLFSFLSRQADPARPGHPDLNYPGWEPDGSDKDVVWESWALTSSPAYSEVFLSPAKRPLAWGTWDRSATAQTQKIDKGFTGGNPAGDTLSLQFGQINLGIVAGDNQEVRMNESTYNTIRGGPDKPGFYSQELIGKAVAAAQAAKQPSFVAFDPGAKEVKARWIQFTDCVQTDAPSIALCAAEKSRYHWRTVTRGGATTTWGLAALHIMTKDLPAWFWADFIHTDCETNPPTAPCNLVTDPNPIDISAATAYPGTEGTEWSYYRLRGTETGFYEPSGKPAVLFNPELEGNLTPSASCISCHALAATSLAPPNASGLITPPKLPGPGVPQECIFHSDCKTKPKPPGDNVTNRTFIQSDFVWSMMMRAKSDGSVHP